MLPGTPPPTPSFPGAVNRLKGFFSRGSENDLEEDVNSDNIEKVVKDQDQDKENPI